MGSRTSRIATATPCSCRTAGPSRNGPAPGTTASSSTRTAKTGSTTSRRTLTATGFRLCMSTWQASRSRRGVSFDDWVGRAATWPRRAEQPCFELVGSYESRLVDGDTARVGTYHCEDFEGGIPYTGVQTMVAHNGLGYAIYVWPAPLPGFPSTRLEGHARPRTPGGGRALARRRRVHQLIKHAPGPLTGQRAAALGRASIS